MDINEPSSHRVSSPSFYGFVFEFNGVLYVIVNVLAYYWKGNLVYLFYISIARRKQNVMCYIVRISSMDESDQKQFALVLKNCSRLIITGLAILCICFLIVCESIYVFGKQISKICF